MKVPVLLSLWFLPLVPIQYPSGQSTLYTLRATTGPGTNRQQRVNRCCLKLSDAGSFCYIAVTSNYTSVMKTCCEDQIKRCGGDNAVETAVVVPCLCLALCPDVAFKDRASIPLPHTHGLICMHWLLDAAQPETLGHPSDLGVGSN